MRRLDTSRSLETLGASLAAALALAAASALAGLGCSGGDGTSQATTICNQDQALNVCITDEIYDQCLACYEKCGEKCNVVTTCPASFTCP
jgi:hypothetical protein